MFAHKKRKREIIENESNQYQTMLNQLDTLIQRDRQLKDIQQDEEEQIVQRKQKKVKTVLENRGEMHRITSQKRIKIEDVQTLNPFLVKALKQGMKFTHLLPTQTETLPYTLLGKDVIVNARTGSGKTLAYLLPCFHNMIRGAFKPQFGTGVIVLVPTRELALQIYSVCAQLLEHLYIDNDQKSPITAGCLLSRVDFSNDLKLFRESGGLNIVVATPGRLLQNLRENTSFNCMNLRAVIIDECDKMLDMGMKDEIGCIMALLPKKRQTMLFSATVTKEVQEISKLLMWQNPIIITDESDDKMQRKDVKCLEKIAVYPLELKIVYLFTLMKQHADRIQKVNEKMKKANNKNQMIRKRAIVFFSMRASVDYHYKLFKKLNAKHCPNIKFIALHGRLEEREKNFEKFTEEDDKHDLVVLFCTDIAARGLDIPLVDLVIQYDIPDNFEQYKHRIGRTGRQIMKKEKDLDTSILMLTKQQIQSRKKFLQHLTDRVQTLQISKEELALTILYHAQAVLKLVHKIRNLAQILIKSTVSFPSNVTVDQILKSMALPLTSINEDDNEGSKGITQDQINNWIEIISSKQK